MAAPKKIRLGDLLVESKTISEQQLMTALSEQKKSGRKLGAALIDLGYIEEDQLLKFLAKQLQIPFVDIRNYRFDQEVLRRLPEIYARRFKAVLLEDKGGECLVGMADPLDIFAYDDLSRILKKTIKQAVVRESDLMRTIDKVYRRTEEISSLAGELGEELSETDIDLAELASSSDVSEAPVVRLLQTIFEDAVLAGASDIHIEPDESVLRIRQRIDGVLQEQVMNEKRVAPALVSRLKLMAGLNISEKRLPQDGRFNVRIKDKSIDVRVSTMPIVHGESVVMRLLDQSGDALSLDQVGMPDDILRRMRNNVHKPHGLVLVTGPTGSGKTTTLYAALSELNKPETKIITVEDPVEYRLPRVNQVQVNTKIGLTFAGVLRTALRQDPDVVLVGEMRDSETAEIGLRAAMTGHLVLSTLHTNDALSTANRLIDMGAEGYLVASSLRAILAQRLIRKICEDCSEPYQPDAQELAWLKNLLGDDYKSIEFRKGSGCPHCNNTGYRGRIGVFELLEIDESLADALRRSDSSGFAHAAAADPNYRKLALNALDYAREGRTTLDEVVRVSGELDEVAAIKSEPEAEPVTETVPAEG